MPVETISSMHCNLSPGSDSAAAASLRQTLAGFFIIHVYSLTMYRLIFIARINNSLLMCFTPVLSRT